MPDFIGIDQEFLDIFWQGLIGRIRKLETDNEHEERVTAENESFLRDQHQELSSKMEAWTRWDIILNFKNISLNILCNILKRACSLTFFGS